MIIQTCTYCHGEATLVKSINTDGGIRIYYWCFECDKNAVKPAFYLKQVNYSKELIEQLPIKENYKNLYGTECAYCGILGSQEHHTAPRYIFGDIAYKFPTVYLCLEHHRLWHDTVDTHYGKPERKSYD